MDESNITQLQYQLEEHLKQFAFKGKATVLVDVAVQAMMQALEQHNEVVAELTEALEQAQAKCKTLTKTVKQSQRENQQLTAKLEQVITNANHERKSAVARANRFKARHDKLLDAIDEVLPGSRQLIEQRGLSEPEKRKQLRKLSKLIKVQRETVNSLVTYDSYRRRDTFHIGYTRERRILQAMMQRKQAIAKRPTYSPVGKPEITP